MPDGIATQRRSWRDATRATSLPLILGASLVLVLVIMGQLPQTCNGVQACPPAGTRPATAGAWVAVVAIATAITCALRILAWKVAARVAVAALILLGFAGIIATLFVTGF